MTNKTIGGWLIGTLVTAVFVFVGGEEDLGGAIIVANWVFVIIAGIRLTSDKLANIKIND